MSELIPEGWEETNIGSVGDVVTGSTPATGEPKYWGGEIPFVSPADFNGEVYVKATERKVTAFGAEKGRKIPKDSILVTCIGSLGGISMAEIDCVTNQQINAVVTNHNYCSKYTYYNILHNIHELEKNAGTTTLPIINKSTFETIKLKFPPVLEQEKIAAILTSVDEVIEKSQAQIDKLQNLKRATMNQLLTRGINHTEFKDSPLGKIPKDWEVSSLRDFAEFRNGLNFSKEDVGRGVPIIGVGDFKNRLYPEYNGLSEVKVDNVITKNDYLQENDFIFVRSNGNRELIGRSMRIKNLGDRDLSYSGFVIRCRLADISPITHDFAHVLFVSGFIRRAISDDGAGTNISNLNQQGLSNLALPIPSIQEQNRISSTLISFDKNIEEKQKRLEQVKALKKSLMQDLLTGKKRVTV